MYCVLFVLPSTARVGDDDGRAGLPADVAQAVGAGADGDVDGALGAHLAVAALLDRHPLMWLHATPRSRTARDARRRRCGLGETERQAGWPESSVDVEDVAAVVSERQHRFDSIVVNDVAAAAAGGLSHGRACYTMGSRCVLYSLDN
jgi:hypothetical protein